MIRPVNYNKKATHFGIKVCLFCFLRKRKHPRRSEDVPEVINEKTLLFSRDSKFVAVADFNAHMRRGQGAGIAPCLFCVFFDSNRNSNSH